MALVAVRGFRRSLGTGKSLSFVGPFVTMKLEITTAARTKILEAQSKIGTGSLVACVGWVKGGTKVWTNAQGNETSAPIQAHWGLGFYERASVRTEQIADIGGIAVLEDDSLDGKTLDFQEGEFRVR